jgi:hypothetical protein
VYSRQTSSWKEVIHFVEGNVLRYGSDSILYPDSFLALSHSDRETRENQQMLHETLALGSCNQLEEIDVSCFPSPRALWIIYQNRLVI